MNNKITADLCNTLRAEITAAMAAVGAKHGLKLSIGNGKFAADYAKFNLDVSRIIKDANGGVAIVSKETVQLDRYAKIYGITPEMLAKPIRLGSQSFMIVGYCSRKSKAPFIMKGCHDGKSYIGRTTQVLPAFGLEVPAYIY